jgi:ParB family chromosome partitioning protein
LHRRSQDLDDAALVMGQAIENIAREDLTYIERAKLAVRMVDEAGLAPADIDTAFSCGKTDRSRYLKVGRGIPDDILSFVGKAPGIGRPRWERLVAHMETEDEALSRMRQALAAANTEDGSLATSDARFSHLYEVAFRSETPAPSMSATGAIVREVRVPSHDKPVGTIKRTVSGVHLTLRETPKPGFLDWLDRNVDSVIGQALLDYERDTALDDTTEDFENDDKGEASGGLMGGEQ